jgi:hypothetical protein
MDENKKIYTTFLTSTGKGVESNLFSHTPKPETWLKKHGGAIVEWLVYLVILGIFGYAVYMASLP